MNRPFLCLRTLRPVNHRWSISVKNNLWSHPKNHKKKMIVAGHPFRGYIKHIAAGFDTCGLKSIALEWDEPERGNLEMIRRFVSGKYNQHRYREADISNSHTLEESVLRIEPDYVLVLNGTSLTDRTLKFCRKLGTRLIFWAYDSPIHLNWIAEAAMGFDLIYTYEPEDFATLSKAGAVRFLPVAHDPSIYHPIADSHEEVDLCFVGSLRNYVPERRRLVRLIADKFRDRTIEVWTDGGRWYSPYRFRTNMISRGRENLRLMMGAVDHPKINELYNRSRICLNIHNPQSRKAVNPRSFEILGSGRFLLTDKNMKDIESLRQGRDYEFYSSDHDLLDKIRYFLENDKERVRIAESGHQTTAIKHTYARRAQTILDDASVTNRTP